MKISQKLLSILCHQKILFFVCMYKMSSDAKRLTKERKITTKIFSKNKTHTICGHKNFTDEDYVIWVKMIDLQNYLHHQNLCHVAMTKIKSYCGTKNPTKKQVKKYKKKRVNGLIMIKCLHS